MGVFVLAVSWVVFVVMSSCREAHTRGACMTQGA